MSMVSRHLVATVLAAVVWAGPSAWAQGLFAAGSAAIMAPRYSTSAGEAVPAPVGFFSTAGTSGLVQSNAHSKESREVSTKAFSAFAIRVKVGSEGIGLDLATPLARRLNLRAGFSSFSSGLNPSIQDIDVVAQMHLSSSAVSVDVHPFAGSFRISPGVSLTNNNQIEGRGLIPPGKSFTFGTADYTSSPDNPLYGRSKLTLGNKIGPRLTMGWGNMIPHKRGQHFSMPFEIGAQYVGAPIVELSVVGTACDSQHQCGSVSSGNFDADVKAEVLKLQNTLSSLKVIPILSMGFSYKF